MLYTWLKFLAFHKPFHRKTMLRLKYLPFQKAFQKNTDFFLTSLIFMPEEK